MDYSKLDRDKLISLFQDMERQRDTLADELDDVKTEMEKLENHLSFDELLIIKNSRHSEVKEFGGGVKIGVFVTGKYPIQLENEINIFLSNMKNFA